MRFADSKACLNGIVIRREVLCLGIRAERKVYTVAYITVHTRFFGYHRGALYYETPIERFWDRLKIVAAKWAASDNPVPENGECLKIVRAEAGSLSLPDDLLDYYAQEFCRMINERRERLAEH
jgi:hypothetical protein